MAENEKLTDESTLEDLYRAICNNRYYNAANARRVVNACAECGIRHVGDLKHTKKEDLCAQRNFGETSYGALCDTLKVHGYDVNRSFNKFTVIEPDGCSTGYKLNPCDTESPIVISEAGAKVILNRLEMFSRMVEALREVDKAIGSNEISPYLLETDIRALLRELGEEKP